MMRLCQCLIEVVCLECFLIFRLIQRVYYMRESGTNINLSQVSIYWANCRSHIRPTMPDSYMFLAQLWSAHTKSV